MNTHPIEVIILGAGGHARVLLHAISGMGLKVAGCVSPEQPDEHWPSEVAWLGDERVLDTLDRQQLRLVNGIGSVKSLERRRAVFKRAKELQFDFEFVRHPHAIIAANVIVDEGAQVLTGAIVQTGACVGTNAIINTGAIVDHDCQIGAHSHLAPGSCLSGNVCIGEAAHIGAGATVIQGVKIGDQVTVGAGSVVLSDIAASMTVAGVPARPIVKHTIGA